jgi:hypothetical protein
VRSGQTAIGLSVKGGEAMDPLEALSTFDWITPLLNTIQIVAGMRPIAIHWSEHPPAHYERVLRKKGIRTGKGGIVAGKGFVILVPGNKVAMARRVLEGAGATLA